MPTLNFNSAFAITGLPVDLPQNQIQNTLFLQSGQGPFPGLLTITTQGVDIDLTEGVSFGPCYLQNFDTENWWQLGLWDGLDFFPFADVPPSWKYPIFLPNEITLGYGTGTGTGTTEDGLTLRAKAKTVNVRGSIEIYER